MKQVEVVAAIIVFDSNILCVQRGENKYEYISKKFEFPGGKIESGETKQETIKREIREELDMDIIVESEFLTVNHTYPDFHLLMHSFICRTNNNNLRLNEHLDFKWLKKEELNDLDWAAADIPIVNRLINPI